MKTKNMVGIGLFTAIVVVLQATLKVQIGIFEIALVGIPIVIGAALYGWKGGAWLGFVFGMVILLKGDANPFLSYNPLGTVLTVLLKGTLGGVAAAAIYKLLEKHSEPLAAFAAAFIYPVVNSGVFFAGCMLFLQNAVMEMNGALSWGFGNPVQTIIFGLIGANFFVEIAINMILVPAIIRLIRIGKR